MSNLCREVVRPSLERTKLKYTTASAEVDGAAMEPLKKRIEEIDGKMKLLATFN